MKQIVGVVTTSFDALLRVLAINSAQAIELRPLLTLDIAEKMALTCETFGKKRDIAHSTSRSWTNMAI